MLSWHTVRNSMQINIWHMNWPLVIILFKLLRVCQKLHWCINWNVSSEIIPYPNAMHVRSPITLSYNAVTDTVSQCVVTDTVPQCAVTDTLSHCAVTDSIITCGIWQFHKLLSLTMSQSAVTDTMSEHAVTDMVSEHVVTDSVITCCHWNNVINWKCSHWHSVIMCCQFLLYLLKVRHSQNVVRILSSGILYKQNVVYGWKKLRWFGPAAKQNVENLLSCNIPPNLNKCLQHNTFHGYW